MARTQTQLTESFTMSHNGPGITKEEQIITEFLLNPEKHRETLNKVSFEEKRKLHEALKATLHAIPELQSRKMPKIITFLLFSIFAGGNLAGIYICFKKQWIDLTIALFIFFCLLLTDFLSLFKGIIDCCNRKMVEMTKFLLYVLIFVFLATMTINLEPSEKEYEIAMGMCGTMMGFFLALVLGREMKKFCKNDI